MKEIRFVNAEDLKTIEDYATALLTGMVSLRTLYAYHLCALDKGILKEDEVKLCQSLRLAIDELLQLYKTQVENLLDRSKVTQNEIMTAFRYIMPDLEIPIKRKNVKKEVTK